MKIYYTTSTIEKGDYSYYGIFAEDGGQFYRYTDLGEWELVENKKQIEYYKTCDKVDLEEYMAKKDKPENLKLFQRTKSRKIETEAFLYAPQPDGTLELKPAPKEDVSYINDPAVVLCQLPDGNFLTFESRDNLFERVMNQKFGRVKVLRHQYVDDGNYTLTDTDTKAIPSDIFEDEVVSTLDEKLNPENENY